MSVPDRLPWSPPVLTLLADHLLEPVSILLWRPAMSKEMPDYHGHRQRLQERFLKIGLEGWHSNHRPKTNANPQNPLLI
jgi:hypothetical protein